MKNCVIEGDSLLVLKELPNEIVDIVITSPPYNAAHIYDSYNDNRDRNEYIKNMHEIFTEVFRILKDDGRICLNVPFAIKNKETKEVTFLAHVFAAMLNEIGFKDFEWITWHKGKNLKHFQGNNTAWGSWKSPSCPSFRPLGEAVLVFYKNQKKHSGKKENIDISGDEFKKLTKNVWYLDNNHNEDSKIICIANNSSKKEHPAPYPEELVDNLLKMYSYVGDLVLDPFNGTGSTVVSAKKLKRDYIGIDLSSKYCDIAIKRLGNGEKIVFNKETSKLVNSSFVKNTLNEYFPYKESFSPDLVPYLIKKYNIEKYDSLLDPFVGTGSVFINDLVNKCIGFDTSKLATEITKAKLVKLKNFDNIKKRVKTFSDKKVKNFNYPDWGPYKKYATKNKYNIVMSLIEYFNKESEEVRRFIKYTLISNLQSIFDYKRDGNGIKYRKSDLKDNDTVEFIKDLLINAIEEKQRFDSSNRKKLAIYNSSSKKCVFSNIVDIVVTSPPYANMFDYFEVYKMELWTSGIVNNRDDLRRMKKTALRNNINADINHIDRIDNKQLDKALKKIELKGIDQRNIDMVNNYFYDMSEVMKKMYKALKRNSYMFIVVGNSFYGGVPIVTDEILFEEGEKIGFEKVEIVFSRKLSTSSQQMAILDDNDKVYLRESIVVLRKR